MSMADIRATFFQECEELLEQLRDGLEQIEGEGDCLETVNAVFRAVHSIKGGGAAFGLDALVRFAHQFETVLDAMRAERLTITDDVIGLCYRASDHLSDLVAAERDGTEPAHDTSEDLAKRLVALVEGPVPPGTVPETAGTPTPETFGFVPLAIPIGPTADPQDTTFGIEFTPTAALFTNGNDPVHLFRTLREMGDLSVSVDTVSMPTLDALDPHNSYLAWSLRLVTSESEHAIHDVFEFVEGLCSLRVWLDAEPAPTVPDMPAPAEHVPPSDPGAASPREAAKPAGQSPKATVRVDLDLVDRLINLVGELVINQAVLAQCVAEAGLSTHTDISAGLDEFKNLSREVQEYVMSIRAQPVKPLFQRMGRIVREASDISGKSVRLVTVGETTEVDKTVIERLVDPLTHILRNAVDHGLEVPETREAAGKPPQGTITLSAAHRSGRVLIEIADDGAGINRPKVREIAITKGLIPPDAVLSEAETDKLLFQPGFSTNAVVTDLSGRGVGMDVVKSAIQALGGRVGIQSAPGKGTTFSISLPLTLAVLDGMVVDVAGQTMVVPITAIVETMRPRLEDIHALAGDGSVVSVRDTFVPIVDLGTVFGHRHPSKDFSDRVLLLVETDQNDRWALAVDSIHDQRQVVIKGLEANYGHVPGVAAATILGDGKIALIIDPEETAVRARPTAIQSFVLDEV
ncbi:chemotaxis protein CheA [Tranquillimonas rosea]|nr:chemotaxis protein CheA [Tranquillimonas rosea]